MAIFSWVKYSILLPERTYALCLKTKSFVSYGSDNRYIYCLNDLPESINRESLRLDIESLSLTLTVYLHF